MDHTATIFLFDRAGDEAFSAIGLGPNYVTQRNATFFTVEAHVSYLAELKPGDKVRVTTQILDHDAKRVHYVQQMFHADEGYLACITENMVLHVSMETRRSAPFPADILAQIDAIAAAGGAPHGHTPQIASLTENQIP